MQKEKFRIKVLLKNRITFRNSSAWAPITCNFALNVSPFCFQTLFYLIYVAILFLKEYAFTLPFKIYKSTFYYFTCVFLVILYHKFKNIKKDKRKQNMSLHNYVVTDIKKVSTKNFQLFPHSFPQQNIGHVLFFSVFNMSF